MTTTAPQPIPTLYRGYRFRSRIEARWAVFFDACDIAYEYEPQGFDLGRALGWYLPDFWLPQYNYWLEIKPVQPTRDDLVDRLLHAFAKLSRKDVFLFFGNIPYPTWRKGYFSGDFSSSDGAWIYNAVDGCWDNFRAWCECTHCGALDIQFEGRADRLACRRAGSCPRSDHGDKDNCVTTPRLMQAYQLARSARFEHPSKWP